MYSFLLRSVFFVRAILVSEHVKKSVHTRQVDDHRGGEFKPLGGRAGDLHQHLSGYVGNVADHRYMELKLNGKTFDESLRLPVLMTVADYLWNSENYDPQRSLDRAFRHLGGSRGPLLQQA
jgi:hypothetical protein